MDFKLKRQLKRRSKTFGVLMMISGILFIIGLVLSPEGVEVLGWVLWGSLIISTFTAYFISLNRWVFYKNKRIEYFKNIQRYRRVRNTANFLNLIGNGKLKEAADFYDSTNIFFDRDFVFGYGLRTFQKSTDEQMKSIAERKYGEYKNIINPQDFYKTTIK